MSKVLRIGNLAATTTAQQLEEICTPFGKVVQVKLAESPYSGISRGFGYIEMGSEDDATATIAGLENQEVDNSKLQVSLAPANQLKKKARAR